MSLVREFRINTNEVVDHHNKVSSSTECAKAISETSEIESYEFDLKKFPPNELDWTEERCVYKGTLIYCGIVQTHDTIWVIFIDDKQRMRTTPLLSVTGWLNNVVQV
jgi:hypothetical protein